ncbi:unnamed protein product [Phytophthora lilii]|uniref:DNA-directed DNA polymerase n=1 Tax=Phytophthora lilii TaxID=2077276 RepID=A0A9W6XP46_9STRA|nr:unnamed protein product [Phytophthora lilii]
MNNGVKAALDHGVTDLIIVGDSRLAIQQSMGVIACRKETLQVQLMRHKELTTKLNSVRYLHAVRASSADLLATEALESQVNRIVFSGTRKTELKTLNRILEVLYADEQALADVDLNSQTTARCRRAEPINKGLEMKANIAGGPSIIFNHYAKRNETKIRGGKVCKKIIGYDANALYLWALGNEMPCGRLTTVEAYDGIIDDIKADKVFGFLECDIRTPEHRKQYFGKMTPIFRNVLIDCTNESVIGKHMFDHNEARKQSRTKPARKLTGSYFGKKILIYTPLLKWYLSHGMEITKTYCFIKASSHKALAPFMEAVSIARREGDVDMSKAMIAEMMKLVGNSAFGRSGMDMSKHKEVKYESSDIAIKNNIEHFTFHGLEELNDACEITMKKRRLNNNNTIHLSIAIYQLVKLRMLQFHYDCIYFYFDRSDFQYQEMDTDSAYIAFSCEYPFQDF